MELTKEEKNLICRFIIDLESGNHLLRPRDSDYIEKMREFCRIRNEKPQDEKSRLINEFADSCYEP